MDEIEPHSANVKKKIFLVFFLADICKKKKPSQEIKNDRGRKKGFKKCIL
jgi:hypothetical protein